mmetsp:Transcript_2914/g.13637  ORF Transcript_2914/g.13637 Transcript_2914/m.13637 type:complete len:229 (+) Transcript_2914:2394-3080(+)
MNDRQPLAYGVGLNLKVGSTLLKNIQNFLTYAQLRVLFHRHNGCSEIKFIGRTDSAANSEEEWSGSEHAKNKPACTELISLFATAGGTILTSETTLPTTTRKPSRSPDRALSTSVRLKFSSRTVKSGSWTIISTLCSMLPATHKNGAVILLSLSLNLSSQFKICATSSSNPPENKTDGAPIPLAPLNNFTIVARSIKRSFVLHPSSRLSQIIITTRPQQSVRELIMTV